MAETDIHAITSDEGHTAECLEYAEQTRKNWCISPCCEERELRKEAMTDAKPKAETACPHPERDGRHEMYRSGSRSVCRACGWSPEPNLPERPRTFKECWADYEKRGYQYGEDALTGVRFGWKIAWDEARRVERLKFAAVGELADALIEAGLFPGLAAKLRACLPPEAEGDCAHSAVTIDRAQGIETCADCGEENP